MGLFNFGKKDKKLPEPADAVAKTPPAPPRVQTPPIPSGVPLVKPPQPSGLVPAGGMPVGLATTQPMVMSRPGTGLKPTRPGVAQSARSTQRIVLPSADGGKVSSTKVLGAAGTGARINLPVGMILRAVPPEVLAADLAEFEASGAAATEIALPLSMVLGQLPSGKIEIPLQDLVAHFPAGFLQPTPSISGYLPTLVNLPLMDVVMRIPPDMLSLRPDQKDVDASVINMADPFTEEILREQAEAARQAAAQNNIIEESQVPQTEAEEFVPQAPAPVPVPVAARSFVPPPPRPPSIALPVPRAPMPPVRAPGNPPVPVGVVRASSPVPPAVPNASSRTISPSGRLPVPSRATTPIPARALATPVAPAPADSDRPTMAMPSLPSLPPVSSVPLRPALTPPTPAVPILPRSTVAPTPPVQEVAPEIPEPIEVPAEEIPVVEAPVMASDDADQLQRLAALAMQQLGEDDENAPITEEVLPEEMASTQAFSSQPPVTENEPEPPVAAATPEPEEPEPVLAAVPEKPAPVAAAFSAPERPAPVATAPLPPPAPSQPAPEAEPSTSVAFNLNTCTARDLLQIPGCSKELGESIVRHRTKIGSFKTLEELFEVPGMTRLAYSSLTGETAPDVAQSLNELLGFPHSQSVSLKDVTDRISCWPDVIGCVLSQSSGLSLVGTVPPGLDKSAIVAFAPRMFEAINKSFAEITGKETNELSLPVPGVSFHILRDKDLYLIILCRVPQMPERHIKVARFVLAALSLRPQ